jgi:hypothetical protein
MKTQTPLYSDIYNSVSSSEITKDANERVADIIIDSFNEQIQLNNQFEKKIKNMIESIKCAYPNKDLKLIGIIDSFIENSKQLSGDFMKHLLDIHFAFNPIHSSEQKFVQLTSLQILNAHHNQNWMKEWMEQVDNFRNNPDALVLIANNEEGFLHYFDAVEEKYVLVYD